MTLPVLYVVACGARPAADLPAFVTWTQDQGWDTCVVVIPNAVLARHSAFARSVAFLRECGVCGALVMPALHVDVTTVFAPQHVPEIGAFASDAGEPDQQAEPVVTQPPRPVDYSATVPAGFRAVDPLSFPYNGGSTRTL